MDGSSASQRNSPSPSGSGLPQLPPVSEGSDSPQLENSQTVLRSATVDSGGYVPYVDGGEGSILGKLFPPTVDSGTHSTLTPAGIELAHFKIEERIGLGGMGAVFRALDTTLQRQVALKLLAPSQSYDSASIKRFRNEARAAARLNHENVATVHFIGEDKGLHFIAFEFVTGSNIRDLIHRRGRMSIPDTVNYGLQIAYALKHVSNMGVVHRDIKPSNIIITPKGRAKLVDLGLARKDSSESQGDLTLPGTTLGTFDYISPEQAKDPRSVDVRSDIYSLGCTIFHMLTGRAPYPDGTVLQKLLEHQDAEAPDPADINPAVPEQLSMIVRRMMNSDRNRRYQTPDQLIRDLTYVAGSIGLKGVNPEGLVWIASRAVRSRNYAALTGWIATLAILLGVVGILHQFPQLSQNLAGIPDERRIEPGDSISGENPPRSDADVAAAQSVAEPPGPVPGGSGEPGRITQPVPLVTGREGPAATSDGESGSETVEGTSSTGSPGTAVIVEVPGEGSDTGAETSVAPVTSTSGSDAETGTVVPATVPQEEFDPFLVLGPDLTLDRRCRTLNAACLAVEDGGVIRLAYSGIRDQESPEKPVRITRKNITIMADDGFSPVVNFVASDVESTPDGQMISVLGGRVSIVGVEFRLTVPNEASGQHYSLFGVSNPARLELSRVAGTIHNPRHVRASFLSGIIDASRMPSDMPKPAGSQQTMDVETTDCIFRGDGSFAQFSFATAARITLTNSAFALQDDLIRIDAGAQSSQRIDVYLTLKHIAAAVEASLVRFEGFAGQEVNSTLHCLARNSVYTFAGSSPDSGALIRSEGAVSSEDARKMITWEGDRNFYNQLNRFWIMEGSQETLDFDDWIAAWGPAQEVGASNSSIPWAVPEWTLAVALREVTSAEFALDPETPGLVATDGSRAGIDTTRLPGFFRPPAKSTPAGEGPTNRTDGEAVRISSEGNP